MTAIYTGIGVVTGLLVSAALAYMIIVLIIFFTNDMGKGKGSFKHYTNSSFRVIDSNKWIYRSKKERKKVDW